jgi:hypothetical protein
MNLSISPKAQAIIVDQSNVVSVKIEKKVSFG